MFFVEATPDSQLAIECEEIMKRVGLNIRVIEKAGISIKQELVKSDPFQRRTCENSECSVCSVTNKKVNCKKRDTVYKLSCNGSHDGQNGEVGNYIGESSRSICERVEEHVLRYDNCDPKSVLYNHIKDAHRCEKQTFNVEILANHPGDPMLRQVREAIEIETNAPDLNIKYEFGNTNVPRQRNRTAQNLQSR